MPLSRQTAQRRGRPRPIASPPRRFNDGLTTGDTGQLLREYKDARGITAATTVYDADGRLQSVTDVDGTTSHADDLNARTTTITHADNGIGVIDTDATGNIVRKVDGLEPDHPLHPDAGVPPWQPPIGSVAF